MEYIEPLEKKALLFLILIGIITYLLAYNRIDRLDREHITSDSEKYSLTLRYISGEKVLEDISGSPLIKRIAYPLLALPFYLITKDPNFSLLIVSALCFFASIPIVYKIVKKIKPKYSFVATFIYAINMYITDAAAHAWTDIPGLLGFLISFYYAIHKKDFYKLGIIVFLTMFLRETSYLVAIIFAIVTYLKNKKISKEMVFLIFFPLIANTVAGFLLGSSSIFNHYLLGLSDAVERRGMDISDKVIGWFVGIIGFLGLSIPLIYLGIKSTRNKEKLLFITLIISLLQCFSFPTNQIRFLFPAILPCVIFTSIGLDEVKMFKNLKLRILSLSILCLTTSSANFRLIMDLLGLEALWQSFADWIRTSLYQK